MEDRDEGVVLPPSRDSLSSAADAATQRLESEGQDTPAEEGHKPESAAAPEAETDIDDLLAKLEANKDKIPGERLQFLNPNMQSGFNRKMNWLQQGAERLSKAMEQTGVSLPPGKSAMDLLTEDDGKGFFDAIGQMNEKTLAPVKEAITAQQTQARVAEMGALAQQTYPLVREHYNDAIAIIAENPDLAKLAEASNWGGLPIVLQGVSTAIAYDKMNAENQSMKKLLEANKIAVKAGPSSSRAGGAVPAAPASKAKTLDGAYEIAKAKTEAILASR